MLGRGFLLELSEQRVWCKMHGNILAESYFPLCPFSQSLLEQELHNI